MADLADLSDWRLQSFLDRARIDCDRLFEFECPKVWGELTPSRDPHVRHCPECDRDVHLAVDEEQLRSLARRRACVAVIRPEELPSPEDAPLEERPMLLGRVA